MKSRKFKSFLFLVVLFTAVTFSCDDSMPEPITGTKPTVSFTATQSASDVFTWSFTNNSSGAVSYNWDFGDGNGTSDANPSHTYTGAGSFTVTLTATAAGTSNSMGWRASSSQAVQIELPTYANADVTFTVDMNNAGLGADDKVYLVGSGDLGGWCADCNQMTSPNNDGIYTITKSLSTSTMYEYKFSINNWARQERFNSETACAYQAPGSEYWNRPLDLGNLDETVSVPSVVYNTCDANRSTISDLVQGEWKIYRMSVAWEPMKFGGAWWDYKRENADIGGDRPCVDNNTFTFGSDGSFKTRHNGDFWLEPSWQSGADAEGCGTPIAPYVDGDFTYSISNDMLTLTGDGAYLGMPKATNTGEDGNAASRTYRVESISPGSMYVSIDYGAGGNRWNIHLKK